MIPIYSPVSFRSLNAKIAIAKREHQIALATRIREIMKWGEFAQATSLASTPVGPEIYFGSNQFLHAMEEQVVLAVRPFTTPTKQRSLLGDRLGLAALPLAPVTYIKVNRTHRLRKHVFTPRAKRASRKPFAVQSDEQTSDQWMVGMEARFALLNLPSIPSGSNYSYSLTGKYIKLSPEKDVLIDVIESLLILYYSLYKAQSFADRMVCVVTFAKLTRSRVNNTLVTVSAITSAFEYFCTIPKQEKFQVQNAETVFTTLQGFLDKYDTIKASPFFEKLHKFGSYALALSLFAPLGITLDHLRFEAVAKEALKKKYHLGPDFIHCMLDTALFLTRRGYQCYQLGTIMPMFHSAEKYQEWYDQAEKLNRQAHFLSNPEVHGIDRFKFLADLKDTIERGQSMRKCALKKDDKLLIGKMLASLELTHDLEVTKRAAQKDRKTPLCMLLFGGSGIGKSTLQNILFQHYGKVRKLSTLPEFRYVRNPTEAFWSGMNSTQWCVVLDDIGFLSPRLGVLDPSLAEMLCIANNVPFVPAQAELSDKGRTPVRAELVLGSTNTEHLNLNAYFSCPLAVQRRFPWVIDVRVKPEYQSVDKPGMLDSSLVPPPVVGCYPDLWIFTIKRVEPCGEDRLHQMGKTVIDREIGDMKTFLVWYNRVIADHNTVQDKILTGNSSLLDTRVCEQCLLPDSWCSCMPVQAEEFDLFGEREIANRERTPSYIRAMAIEDVRTSVATESWITKASLIWYMLIYFVVACTWLNHLPSFMWGSYWFSSMVAQSPHRVALARTAIRYAGARVERRFGVTSSSMSKLAAVVVGVAALYKVHGSLMRNVLSMVPQGGVASTVVGKPPQPVDETSTSPHADPHPYSSSDLSSATLCSKGLDGEHLQRHVADATCVFITHCEGVRRTTTAVNVRGSVYLVNNHGIPAVGPFMLDIVHKATGTMSTSSKGVLVTESMIVRVPSLDQAYILLKLRPPGYDLTKFLPSASYTGHLDGVYVGRTREGDVWSRKVVNIKDSVESWKSHNVVVTVPTWGGTVDQATDVGDCGTILMSNTPAGWVLLGIHTLGRGSQVRSLKLHREGVVAQCDLLEDKVVNKGFVQVSAPSQQREVSTLSAQSVVHSVVGTADVLGSFKGEFRQRGRTRVADSYLAPFLLKYGYERTRVPPNMGSKPWILALKDMTRPVLLLDNDVLTEAVGMFIEETRVLDYSSVHVYDLATAINGCPGLQYCDKLNRKSSAGAPYKRSKSHFMYFVNESESTDMDVVEEIKGTIDGMIATYKRGERVHPVFCGHLKDEPVTFEKAEACKTRVFTAAGMAHTLVVRMYMLSVIVFMQKRRFTFETGPGVVVQSCEWEQVREYLTQYGETNMVAGDYAKFDKRMPASVILATFDIMEDICRKAGYSDADLRVVRGIGYDTAFPTVDFHGELIEFYGSNPSGHALTVIVNGIANSLYMRYAYLILRPPTISGGFKQKVCLMTYGDDNAMGVHESAPWFNHTAIQRVLADVDIQYTMAEKEAASVPYIHIDDVSFLKRTWRYDGDVGAYVAPLDRSSIQKMLTVCVQKGNISPKCHAIQVISTAVRELFFYGREEYETGVAMLERVVGEADLELYVESTTFPTWEQLVADFWERSKHVRVRD